MNSRYPLLAVLALVGISVVLFTFLRDEGGALGPVHVSGPSSQSEESGVRDLRGFAGLPDSDGAERSDVSNPADPGGNPAQTDSAQGAFLRVVNDWDDTPAAELYLRVVVFGPDAANERGITRPSVLAQHLPKTSPDGMVDLQPFLGAQSGAVVRSLAVMFLNNSDWELQPSAIRPTDLGATQSTALELRAFRRQAAPVRGLVLDKETGQPLPHLALRAQRWLDVQDASIERETVYEAGGYLRSTDSFDGPTAEWIITDETGRFVTADSYAAGRIGFLTLDHERTDGQHILTPTGEALETEFRLSVGPIILLNFDPPGGRQHSDFVAGIWRAPAELVRTEGVFEWPSPWSPDGGSKAGLAGNATPVRGSSPTWFRPSLENVEDAPLPSRVFLASRDGRVFGHAPLSEYERYAHEPLRVELQERSSLDVLLVWPEGEPRVGYADVTLSASGQSVAGASAYVADRWVPRWETDAETPFDFQFVPPGRYTLAVTPSGARSQALQVAVPSPEPVRVEITRPPPSELHQVKGRVFSSSGASLDGQQGRAQLTALTMQGLKGSDPITRIPLDWKSGEALFSLEDVPAGDYVFNARWRDGALATTGLRVSTEIPVRPKGTGLEFRVDDDVPTQTLEVRVIDPQDPGRVSLVIRDDQGSLAHAFLGFCADGDLTDGVTTLLDGRRAAVARFGPYPLSAKIDLTLWMEGYRSPVMNEDLFSPPDANGLRTAEIPLRKGWSVRIHTYETRDGEDLGPLEGIVLAFDGNRTTPSSAAGFIYSEADESPTHLQVITPGWQLVDRSSWSEWGSVFAQDGSFTVEDGRLTVFVQAR